MPSSAENNKRIAKNTIFLYLRMLVIMLVTLYTSRVVLDILGVTDYGIYNVVGGIVVLFSFFNSALTSATQRFLSFELGRGDKERFRTIVNISAVVYFILSIIIFSLGETIGLWFLNNKMEIPDGKMADANWVYQFSMLSFVFGILRTPYNASIIAHERMSFYALISVLEAALRLAIVFVLPLWNDNQLIIYSILMAIVALLTSSSYAIYCFCLFKECRPRKEKDKSVLKNLLSFSSWSLLGSFAAVSASQGVNIVTNIFYGVTLNAAMGISHQVSQAVNQLVANFQTAFNPQITKTYAIGDNKYLSSLLIHSGKLSFYLMTIIAIPLVVGIDLVLNVWLTVVPKFTNIFCQLTIISYLIDTLSAPLYMVVQATGKIRIYQISVSSLLLLNIILSYTFFSIGLPPETAMYVKVGISFVLLFFRLLYLHNKDGISMASYARDAVGKPMALAAAMLTISAIAYPTEGSTTVRISALFIMFLASTLIIYSLGLSSNERKFIVNLVLKKQNAKQNRIYE